LFSGCLSVFSFKAGENGKISSRKKNNLRKEKTKKLANTKVVLQMKKKKLKIHLAVLKKRLLNNNFY